MKDTYLLTILAICFLVFLCPFFNGLYVGHDVAGYADQTIVAFEGKGFYSCSWHNKPPGIHYIFWLAFCLFGKSFLSIQIVAFFSYLITLVSVYFITKTSFGKIQALIASTIFVIITGSGIYHSYGYNTETFLVPFTSLGILLLVLSIEREKPSFLLLSAFLFGLGFLVKQVAIFPFLAAFIYQLIYFSNNTSYSPRAKWIKRSVLYAICFVFPTIAVSIYFYVEGRFENFITYAFLNNITHVKSARAHPLIPFNSYMYNFFCKNISMLFPIAVIASITSWRRGKNRKYMLIILWAISEILSTSSGGWYFLSYFIVLFAPFSVLAGCGIFYLYIKSTSIITYFPNKRIIRALFKGVVIISLVGSFTLRPTLINISHISNLAASIVEKRPLCYPINIPGKYNSNWDKQIVVDLGKRLPRLPKYYRSHWDKHAVYYLRKPLSYFLSAKSIKRNLRDNETIYVWDDTEGCALYFWAGCLNPTSFRTKWPLLPAQLTKSTVKGFYPNYKRNRSKLMGELRSSKPAFIVISRGSIDLAEKSFPDLFHFVENHYRLWATNDYLLIYNNEYKR